MASEPSYGVVMLRELADQMEKESVWVDEMRSLMRRITASCPWELDAGGMPEFWYCMRRAQALTREIDEEVGT